MKKSKNANYQRREVLKILSALPASVPTMGFAQLLFGGLFQEAMAQSTPGVSGKKYVYFTQPGSPPRWMFDLLLVPHSKTGFQNNGGVGTVGVESGGRYVGLKYETILRKGLNVPPVWGVSVPDATGALRPMDSLLDNMMVIRGIDVAAPGHPLAQTLSFRPVGAEYTVTGLTAEAGTGFPIKALNMKCPGYEFASRQTLTPTTLALNGASTGIALLGPFSSAATTTFLSRRDQLKTYIDAALTALDQYATSQHPGLPILSSAQADAAQVMGQRAKDLLAKWNIIYPKYVQIMKSAITDVVIPGLTDKPYGESTRPTDATELKVLYKFYSEDCVKTPLDMREMFTASTVVSGLAESFALVELALTENLCNSVCTPINHLTGLSINGTTKSHINDEHFTAAFTALILNTKMYTALGSCLLELVSVLKTAGLFNDTVIQVGGEFNRSPKNDGSSSDHGYQGGSTTIISGMIQQPTVIGNVLNSAPSTMMPGSWGFAAPSIGGRNIDVADVANALAKMLGLPQILRRTDELVTVNAGVVTSAVGTASQV